MYTISRDGRLGSKKHAERAAMPSKMALPITRPKNSKRVSTFSSGHIRTASLTGGEVHNLQSFLPRATTAKYHANTPLVSQAAWYFPASGFGKSSRSSVILKRPYSGLKAVSANLCFWTQHSKSRPGCKCSPHLKPHKIREWTQFTWKHMQSHLMRTLRHTLLPELLEKATCILALLRSASGIHEDHLEASAPLGILQETALKMPRKPKPFPNKERGS